MKENMTTNNKPAFEIFVVREGSNKKSYFTKIAPDELEQYDTRGPNADLKGLMDSDPKLGFVFRTVVEKVKNGELTAEDIVAKLSKRKSRA
jgi:hypothetical protein